MTKQLKRWKLLLLRWLDIVVDAIRRLPHDWKHYRSHPDNKLVTFWWSWVEDFYYAMHTRCMIKGCRKRYMTYTEGDSYETCRHCGSIYKLDYDWKQHKQDFNGILDWIGG